MLSILLVVVTLGSLYGFLARIDWAIKRWLPVPTSAPIMVNDNVIDSLGGVNFPISNSKFNNSSPVTILWPFIDRRSPSSPRS